jgi:predicted anti-sigma-YlaC factor YlaD
MNCHFCQKESDAYHKGTLSDGLRMQVEMHLEHCSDCSESFQLWAAANEVMEAEKAVKSNPFLVTRIMAGIEEMEHEGATRLRIPAYQKVLKPILISASLAAAIFIGVFVGSTYLPTGTVQRIPVELSYMNDAALESVDLYSQL